MRREIRCWGEADVNLGLKAESVRLDSLSSGDDRHSLGISQWKADFVVANGIEDLQRFAHIDEV